MRNKIIHGFKHDALKITQHNQKFYNVNLVDTWTYLRRWLWIRPHIDGWQLIPTDSNPENHNMQYGMAILHNIQIKFCSVISKQRIQPIFCSDGVLVNVHISNNAFITSSQHHISLNGCLSGVIRYNTANGEPARVILRPIRIGGGNNIWVIGFKNGFTYKEINTEKKRNQANHANFSDLRREKQPTGISLINFDVLGYQKAVRRIQAKNGADKADKLAELALKYGTKV